MVRRSAGVLSVYVPKKDLEETVIAQQHETLWGGRARLKNGWTLIMPDLPADTRLPITVNARKLGGEAE